MYKLGSVGITSVSIAPIRASGSDLSEQVSQSIAGENVSLLEIGDGDWLKIKNLTDGYIGWSDRKQFVFNIEQTSTKCMLNHTMSIWTHEVSGTQIRLPAGALLDLNKTGDYLLAGDVVRPIERNIPLGDKHVGISDAAMLFLNAPYQWGGRTISGIDCSGLSQIAAALNGVDIPRDASQQVKSGKGIDWDMRSKNDLAFFENKQGSITHVGILTSMNTIIHASGCVRIDKLTTDGIVHVKEKKISHKLNCIRRLD